MTLFHTGYSWYIPSSSHQARLLCRLLPKVGSILSSLLKGFQQGVNVVLRVDTHLLVGQVNVKVDTSQPVQDTGDRIGTAFTGHVHKELVFLERKEAVEGSGRPQLETHHRHLSSTLAFFLVEVGSKPPKTKGPHTHPTKRSSAKPRALGIPPYGVLVLSPTA